MTNPDRFPITLWPEGLMPEPDVWVPAALASAGIRDRLERRQVLVDVGGADVRDLSPVGERHLEYVGSGTRRRLPPEFFLRELLDLRLDGDPDEAERAVAELTLTAGYLDVGGESGAWVHEHTLDAFWPPRGRVFDLALATLVVMQLQGLAAGLVAVEDGAAEPPGGWVLFAGQLSNYVSKMSPTVQVADTADRARASDLATATAVQMWNYCAERDRVRMSRCASATCGRPFVRQRDGAEHGQFRTKGVIYCSKACARAQAQREYRRRQRQEKSG